MRNTKLISIILIVFVIITTWIQIPDIKSFITKSGVFTKNEANIIQNDNLQAIPFFEETTLTSDSRNTNLPGPLDKTEENTTEEGTQPANIKQPNFDLNGIIKETNIYRSQNGTSTLKTNSTLNQMAKEKMEDMFTRGYFEHISPQGVSIEDLAENNNYEYLVIGENLALGGFKTAEDVVKAWSESTPHRENMLDPRYTEIGVAVKRALYKGHAATIIVQHFGKSISSCPTVSKQTKASIDNLQSELQTLKSKIEVLKKQIEEDYSESAVKEHNNLVSEYNKKLAKLKILVEDYNAEVEGFNACVEKIN